MDPEDLPDAEMDVLAVLWHLGEATARQVREALTERRPMTHGAMCMLLRRLSERSFVTRRPGDGRAYLYRATIQPTRTQRNVVGRVRDQLFAGDSVALVQSLFDHRSPTSDEVRALEDLLEDLKSRREPEDEP